MRRGAGGAARRLSMARGFLIYLKASAPDTEVPSPGLLPTPRRPKPFLFTPTQITTLLAGAQASRPPGSLRPHTLSCLLGLLASTGLRVGEALRLQIDQVKLELDPPQLHILETSSQSRIVPVHPSTAERLRQYHEKRAHYTTMPSRRPFRVRTRRAPEVSCPTQLVCRLCQRVAIVPIQGGGALSDVLSPHVCRDLYEALV
jgi:integrase